MFINTDTAAPGRSDHRIRDIPEKKKKMGYEVRNLAPPLVVGHVTSSSEPLYTTELP